MAWDFETDPEFQEHLDWMDEFVTNEVQPLDLVLDDPYDKSDTAGLELITPLQEQVRERGLWACHLGPELGGPGYGQVKLALMNQILGRSRFAPTVFGCQAPDSGNAEILAHYGSDAQKERYLQPLLDGKISSCYSMTEPQGGADPTMFTTTAVKDGDEWVINGEKWFSSNAKFASFFIVMVVTNPDVSAYEGMSMFIVPAETPGVKIIRNTGIGNETEAEGSHAYMHYDNVRVSNDHLLGDPGAAFAIAQTRLGGGRIHHAMRTIAQVEAAFAMMCERALSRETRNGPLASLGVVQEQIADTWIEIEQFKLLVLRTAWRIDKYNDYRKVRKDISAVKVAMPKVYHDVALRAMHLHGALGVSNEMPFTGMLIASEVMALADGPTEVHKTTVARQVLREHKPVDGLWPSAHIPARKAAAREKYAAYFEREAADH
ncbi:acyl-CoA dehydrogenase family protein [Ilumatobacter coccineus]|jgi:acyl-CoA dehydrogenase|uniref:Putative acyl-CoA dehydrogenase n=1 Tax=Ilumatobacter coccineus (strain NBRC 103263 / KCTC 29153 / YM16-304) TaxID=1313172 RepID=A0A6C7EEH6_ILUCY|nr:acyl-CoA dehydrogenase family protein [Ilumatobacter coccineus]BAN03579.1 putative acyl-CoA dehydrogenase [Ilumatobacter coccineus YM16-304]